MSGSVSPTGVAVSIVVPCYDRLALVERTLKACLPQAERLSEGRCEIIVADNHPDRLAAPLVQRLADESLAAGWLIHVPAGERNIAQARNVGVCASSGAFIAFVDDDEAPERRMRVSAPSCPSSKEDSPQTGILRGAFTPPISALTPARRLTRWRGGHRRPGAWVLATPSSAAAPAWTGPRRLTRFSDVVGGRTRCSSFPWRKGDAASSGARMRG